MRHLHESLRSEGHLKHGGRNQYGLFLKVPTAVSSAGPGKGGSEGEGGVGDVGGGARGGGDEGGPS